MFYLLRLRSYKMLHGSIREVEFHFTTYAYLIEPTRVSRSVKSMVVHPDLVWHIHPSCLSTPVIPHPTPDYSLPFLCGRAF